MEDLVELSMSNDENKKENYIIIGNGFDLSMGMKSSYNDFLEDVIKHYNLKTNEQIYEFNHLFVKEFQGEQLSWSDFETLFELQMLEINQSPEHSKHEQLKNYRVKKLNEDLRQLEVLFYYYIKKEYARWKLHWKEDQLRLNPLYSALFADERSHILTFNFTGVLHDIFKKNNIEEKNIYQLHGSLENNNIIFGGGFTGRDDIEKVNLSGSLMNDKLVRIKKDSLLFGKREELISQITKAKEDSCNIFILGHSIMGSDFIFLRPFFERAEKIYMFYYSQDFSEKLQYFIKTLGREYAEKIYLIPFFDILSGDDDKLAIDGLSDYELVRDIFNLPIPQDEEGSVLFEHLQIYHGSFMLQDIKQIKISTRKELEKIIDIFNKLNPETVRFLDNFQIKINDITGIREDGLESKELLSKLFEEPVFKAALSKAAIFEINNCDIFWDDFIDTLDVNVCEELKLTRNNIFYTHKNSRFDIGQLSLLKDIEFEGNELVLIINEVGSETKEQAFKIGMQVELKMLHSLVILNNTEVELDETFSQHPIRGYRLKMEIDSKMSKLLLPEVEDLELVAIENCLLPKLEINQKIEMMRFSDFSNEKIQLSDFFSKGILQLNALRELSFNNMTNINELHSNILCNTFNYQPVLKYENDEFLFSDIQSELLSFDGVFNIQTIFSKSIQEHISLHNEKICMTEQMLNIPDLKIQNFASAWGVRLEDLEFFFENYKFDQPLGYQNGFKALRAREVYNRYKKADGKIDSFLNFKNGISEALETLIKTHSVKK
ncbi:AbiH family protein [uncultured Vagococcus sp.]|uniref:AbiH family protein n=1 Tax=uncultured Vagococcus sp. TaxID=189676 RepID=UPI0028D231A0|nr:AbiH family protein [uncultured Vagococcus sp.]